MSPENFQGPVEAPRSDRSSPVVVGSVTVHEGPTYGSWRRPEAAVSTPQPSLPARRVVGVVQRAWVVVLGALVTCGS